MVAFSSWLAKIFVWAFIWKWVKRIMLGFFILSISGVFLFKWLPVPVTFYMVQRCVQQKMDGEQMKLKKDWVRLDEISPYLQLAVVCAEDQNYLKHDGFDFGAIDKAIRYNDKMEEKGRTKRRGASTISQQTAKNVFLWHGRSWIRKGFEVYFTFLIETLWSKERIMEVYLNVIEFGDGVYGAEATSQYYFKKSSHNISAADAALMAIVLPNPRKFSIARPSKYILSRQRWCLQQMRYWGMKLDYDKENKKVQELNQGKEEE